MQSPHQRSSSDLSSLASSQNPLSRNNTPNSYKLAAPLANSPSAMPRLIPLPSAASTDSRNTIGIAANTSPIFAAPTQQLTPAEQVVADELAKQLDGRLFEALIGPRQWAAAEATLVPTKLYGDFEVIQDKRHTLSYAALDIQGGFDHGDGRGLSYEFSLAYDVFRPPVPRDSQGRPLNTGVRIPTLLLTHGVPVNRREWYPVARLLARCGVRVVTIDLLGMGDSSMPLGFHGPSSNSEGGGGGAVSEDDWHWSLETHAKAFERILSDWQQRRPHWFTNDGKLFFGANDWGAGVLQKFIEIYGDDYLLGASINSAIALDGYWVQHIGALYALTKLPYPSPQFQAEAIRFAGTLTTLLETMFHRTPALHNQYSMAPMQEPYVDVSAYWDPTATPATTHYKAHNVRVLAEHAAHLLGKGQLLPYHANSNPRGMRFTHWNVPLLVMWGKHDKMMPEAQVYRLAEIVGAVNQLRRQQGIPSNLTLEYRIFENAGHFAVFDQPERSADALLHWMHRTLGREHFASAYLGFDAIARQDEETTLFKLQALHADIPNWT